MITVKEELRLVSSGDGTMRFVLTDTQEGIPLSDVSAYSQTNYTFDGFKDVLAKFRLIERKRSIPRIITGAITVSAGAGMCGLGKTSYGIGVMAIGSVGMLCGLHRRNALMFRDCVGNEVDLFLGMVYLAGTKKQQYLHFASLLPEDGYPT